MMNRARGMMKDDEKTPAHADSPSEVMTIARSSPFRPSFGVTPPLVAGRDSIIAEFSDALEAGAGAAGRAALFTGNRGIGKTVMLNEVENEARALGWVVVSETATRGLLGRLTHEGLPDLAMLLSGDPEKRARIAGVTLPAGLGGVKLELPPAEEPGSLRTQTNALTDVLAAHGTGLLITIDEVHAKNAREDVLQLCAVIQHAFREQRPVALAAAGLPAAVQDLLTADVSTFLRRARRHVLQPLAPSATEEALRVPIEEAGRTVRERTLQTMATATYGYPYLVQAVGDHVWRQDPSSSEITSEHAAVGIDNAIREAGFALHEPALNDLSEMDRKFVLAMVPDHGPTPIAAVGERLGRDHGWISRYRARLLVAGIVEPAGRGRVQFTIPYLREFLAERTDRY